MPTFIDRLETELVQACEAGAAPRHRRRVPLKHLSRGSRWRLVAALGVVAAVAAPAIAAGLSPVLRDFLGQTVSTSADAPPAEQLALLGILRDPPAQAIVDPATLGTSLLSGIHGIRTGYIRRLPAAPGFPHQLLYTVTSGEIGGPAINPRTGAVGPPPEAANLICVESFEPDGGGGDCTETSVLTSGHWIESSGLDGYGLVPDGVASVVLRYSDHPSETEAVTENTFSFRGYPAPEGPVVNGTPQTSPGPTPEVPSSVTWLNAHGEVIFTRAGSNVAPAKPRA